MIILHVSGLNSNKAAGPTTTVPKNVEYGSKYADVALYNCVNNKLDGIINQDKIFLMDDYPSISDLPSPFNKPDIVVFQSMYIKKFIKVYKELKKRNIPYIITPRVALTKKAQSKKKWKKIVGNILFFNKFIKNATAINYLTENEYLESRQFKIKDYFINGNGIDSKKKYRDFDIKNDKFMVTFIGRIEWYHKGLDYLIEAINIGQNEFRNKKFIFNLYGPDDFNSYTKLQKMIVEYKINDLVHINGPVFGKEKEKILLKTDLFIHTSRMEGQPNAVIEAISYGIPVFVTPGTNIDREVSKYNLGFISNFDIKDIKDNLLKAYVVREKFKIISKNNINYAKKNFDWDIIVKKNIAEYAKRI